MPVPVALALALLVLMSGCRAHAASDEREALEIGAFDQLPQSTVIRAELTTQGEPRRDRSISSGYESYTTAAVNVLLLDTETEGARWLYPSNEQWIRSSRALQPQDSLSVLRAVLYHVVTKDTDDDGKLDRGDVFDVVVARPDGSERTSLVEGVSETLGTFRLSADSVLVTYRRGQSAGAVALNLETLTGREVPIPSPPGGEV